MKERPIIFSGPMVRAILDDRKTQTRRVIRCSDRWNHSNITRWKNKGGNLWDAFAPVFDGKEEPVLLNWNCPYGQPGDRLWVRETWRIGAWRGDGRMAIDYSASPELTNTPWVTIPDDDYGDKFNDIWEKLSSDLERKKVFPEVDGHYHWEPGKAPLSWKPSIHMPRWASRINLEIVSVRVERVHEIVPADVRAEGIQRTEDGSWLGPLGGTLKDCLYPFAHAWEAYSRLWDSINAKRGYGWDANPWCWVLTFKKVADV
jgi:hypothetical protein